MAAARKRSKPPPKRATRSLLAARPSLPTVRLPELEPHHVDVLGLGLIALGVLLGGVAYVGDFYITTPNAQSETYSWPPLWSCS